MWPQFTLQAHGIILDPQLTALWGTAGMVVLAGFIFILGCCLGSFANACAMRLVRDEDFILSASRCRGCDRLLRWHDNLPIVGYVKLRGRCQCGKTPIAPRYFIVEILGPASAIPCRSAAPGDGDRFSIGLVFVAIACLTDLEALTLHPALLTVFGLTGLLLSLLADFHVFAWHLGSAQSLAGIVFAAAVPMLINAIYRAVRGQNGFGEGDFWLLAPWGMAWTDHGYRRVSGRQLAWRRLRNCDAGAWPRVDNDTPALRSVCRNCVYPLVEFIYAGILAPANIKFGSVTRPEMSASSFQSFRPLKIAGAVSAVSLLLYGCGAPERLPSDLSMDGSKDVLKEKIIAPIKGIDEEEDLEDFVELPRRSLIQVRHAPTSLDDQYFVSTLSKLLSVEPVEADGDAEADTAAIAQNRQLDEAERTAITEQRAIQRTETLVELGLQYETQLLAALQPLDGEIKLRESTTIGGLGDAIPVFGRNLTGNGDEDLEIPADRICVGGEYGTSRSKTAILKQVVQNPEITFAVRDMPLGDALTSCSALSAFRPRSQMTSRPATRR